MPYMESTQLSAVKRLIFTTGLLTLLLLPLSQLHAETVWKWVDDEGVTHYTDKASVPEGVPSEEVPVPEPGLVVEDAEDTTQRLKRQAEKLEQDRKQRAQQAEEAERAQALEEALEREEIFVEPEKKKKKRRKKKQPPVPPPPPPPQPDSPGFKQ